MISRAGTSEACFGVTTIAVPLLGIWREGCLLGAEHKPGVWWDGVSCLEFPAGNGAGAEVAVGFVL